MPTPFPGMDPYLERPNLWHGIHNRLIATIADILGPLLRPRYFVAVEERSYLADPLAIGFSAVPDVSVVGPYTPRIQPDRPQPTSANVALVEPQTITLPMPERIRETYLEIQEMDGNNTTGLWMNGNSAEVKVVTLLEILSPWNKASREGRVQYERKRQEVFNSYTNFVEIDLLRAGQRMTPAVNDTYHYNILVSPSTLRPHAHLYAFTVRQPIPTFQLPLQPDDVWPVLDLNTILHALYERGAYDLRIDYQPEPIPPFRDEDAQWLDMLLRSARLRSN